MDAATDSGDHEPLPARLPKGFAVGGCVVEGWLRDGGMAAIYRARRTADDRRVALKLQLPSTAHDPAICARFDREAEVMWRASGSPHVVEIYDAGVLPDGRRYFVMEWVEGENLEELLDFLRNQDQRLPIARACRIGRNIARGLTELHEHGVLHLDLKPANVMVAHELEGDDEIKLVDFGIAADLRETQAAAQGPHGAAVMGTSGYMAPEQVHGHPPSPAFDVYALGVLLFESLSGTCVPPDGWTPETLPRVETRRRGIPPRLAALVRACMDFDPTKRPASPLVVAAELVKCIVALGADERRGADRASSEEMPVRTGGTELVPRASVVAETLARTGGTEVALTHEEVLESSGFKRLPASATAAPTMAQEEAVERTARPWVRWVVIGGVAAAVVAAIGWMIGERPEDAPTGPSAAAAQARARGEPQAVVKAPLDAASSKVPVRGAKGVALAGDAGVVAVDDGEHVPTQEAPASDGPAAFSTMSKPSGPGADACKENRAGAFEAKDDRAWRKVLHATSKRGCWTTAGQKLQRKQLRVLAYAELGEFGKCVSEGGASPNEEIEARVRFCKKQLGG